jgi:branched-chain amino acid aminotransferase
MKVYINGKMYPENEAKISVLDHGLLYGDGIFEGIRVYKNRIFKLEEHVNRLFDSAKYIMLKLNWTKEEIIKACVATCKENGVLDNGYIRLIITRGTGDLGLDPLICENPQLIIIASTIQLYPEKFYKEGLEIITVPTRRNIPEASSPNVKSLNYLNNILAKIEAKINGYNEAIMLDNNGFVAECTGDNIFFIKDNVVVTPPAYIGALKGITRDTILELAKNAGIKCEERLCTRYDFYTADEAFLTGSAAEVVPVVLIDKRNINDGKPGPLTTRLISLFRDYTSKNGTPIE